MAQVYHEHYTVDDYRQWEGDWELIQGMPYAMTPSPGLTHQLCLTNLAHVIKDSLEEEASCADCLVVVEMDWQVSGDTVVRPDLLLTCREVEETLVRPPELVAEVVSASSTIRDEQIKFELYAREGVAWYLLLYPERRLARFYRNRDGAFVQEMDATDGQAVLAIGDCRLELNVGRIWR
ncbi:MAG: Uma2 family endonuclease [Gammaproteobacteria bacterium]|nr:MAG: Uma2 family endonuclease [Gammaproteobacteria bacterium]